MHIPFLRWAPAIALSVPLLALAEQHAQARSPKVSAPALRYESAFADYRPWQDIRLADWRQLNDALVQAPGGAGSHAGHAMGGSSPAAPAPKASAPAAPAHQGHQMQHKHGANQ